MISETLVVLAFGTAMLRPPTRHEGWSVQQGQTRSAPLNDDTACELLSTSAAAPSLAPAYLATDRAIDPIAWLKVELDTYAKVEAGWDGPRSLAPDPSHVEEAKAFVDLLPAGLLLPKPMLSPTGEIGLYWRGEGLFADVVMEGKNKVSIFVRSGAAGAHEEFLDDVVLDDKVGTKLLAAIERAQRKTRAH